MDVKTANGCLEDARALLTTSPGDAETRAREVPCQHFTSHQTFRNLGNIDGETAAQTLIAKVGTSTELQTN